MGRAERTAAIRAAMAEAIARAIEDAVCPPAQGCKDRFCPDCIRWRQARADAATARRLGRRT
jgi:hypothetical protein